MRPYIILLIFLVLIKSVLSQAKWEMILPPSPTSNQLVSLNFINETTGWSVGEYGTILKTIDGGNTWRIIEIPQLNYLRDVYFPTAATGYIVGEDGIILKSIDGGESWTQQLNPFTNNLNRVRFINETTGWIVGEKGLILHANNGGHSWTQQISNSRENLNSLYIINNKNIFVVGNNSTILMTSDEGISWRKISYQPEGYLTGISNLKDVYFLDAHHGWIGGSHYGSDGLTSEIFLHTSDGGNSWSRVRITNLEYEESIFHAHSSGSIPNGIQQIYFLDLIHGLLLTNEAFSGLFGICNLPFKTKDGGKNWFSCLYGSLETSQRPGRFFVLAADRIINIGFGGEFRISIDGGANWKYANQKLRNWLDLHIGNNGNLIGKQFIWNEDKQKYIQLWKKSQNFGKIWELFQPQFFDSTGLLQTDKYLGRPGNYVDHHQTLYTIVGNSVYKSKDDGLNWYFVHSDATFRFNHPSRFLTPDTLIRYEMRMVEKSPNRYRAELHFTYSFDAGRTESLNKFVDIWNEITPYKIGNPIKFVSKDYFFNGAIGFLIGSEGNIIKTTDTGRSWRNIPSGVVEDLWDITFVNRQTGFVVGDFGRILKTEDGGETWQRVPMRYIHGPIREIEFDKDGTGYAYTHKFYPNEDWNSRPGGYILLLVLKEGGVEVAHPKPVSPYSFALHPNYPNPFNSTTIFRFSLPETEAVTLKIYNIRGQRVHTLVDKSLESGEHEVIWNGTNQAGQAVASGVYVARLR